MHLRERQGLEIANWHRLEPFDDGDQEVWEVPTNQSGKGTCRVVYHEPQSCTCGDFKRRTELEGLHKWCKHIWAVHVILCREFPDACMDEDGNTPYPVPTNWPLSESSAPRRKLKRLPLPRKDSGKWTERQDTEADAYLNEHFPRLLYELCSTLVPAEPDKRNGRPPIRFQDQAFVSVYKVFEGKVTRDFGSKLKAMEEEGYIAQSPYHTTIASIMGRASLTPALKAMVSTTACEFSQLDRHFAIDSTQFRTPREVYGGRAVKLHLMCGLRTKIVTAATVTPKDFHDSPQLPVLVNETVAMGFSVESVVADSQYSSAENYDLVDKLGAIPFLEFATDATGGVGGSYGKWWDVHFGMNHDRYVRGMSRRKTVESVNRMIKAKYGSKTHCRTMKALENEVLCKVVCHNIRRIVYGVFRYGLRPSFWPYA